VFQCPVHSVSNESCTETSDEDQVAEKEKVPAVIMSEKTPAAVSSARGWRSNWQGNKRHAG
jgi:hypothetical protein